MNFKKYFEKKKIDEVLSRDLTPREVQVISLIATGSSIAEVAKTLFIGECTVKQYKKSFISKLMLKTSRSNQDVATTNFYWAYHKELIKRAEPCKK